MAGTRRLRKGYEVIAMAMPSEDALRLRLHATAARQSLGDFVACLLPADPIFPIRPDSPNLALFRAEREARSRPQERTQAMAAATEGGWTPERLREALAARGHGSQAALAKHLALRSGSATIRSWVKRIPTEYWAGIDAFFAESTES